MKKATLKVTQWAILLPLIFHRCLINLNKWLVVICRNGIKNNIKITAILTHCFFISAHKKWVVPSFFASASLEGDVLITVTSAPNDTANFNPI